jgi:hypothetical protein
MSKETQNCSATYTDVLWEVASLIKVPDMCACESGNCKGLASRTCRMRIAEQVASVVTAGVTQRDREPKTTHFRLHDTTSNSHFRNNS